MVVPPRQIMFDRVQFVITSFRTAFEIFVKWEPGSTVTRTRIYTANKYETFSRTDMVVSCWSTGSRALQKYTPQPHTVTNSLCQSDPEWRTMTWAKPSQSPGCDGVAKATKQLTIKKGVGGFVHLVHFFHAKSGRFGDGNTNQQSLRRIASRMKLFHRTFQSIGSQNVNERDRQTDKTRQASQPARQTDRHTDTHTQKHTRTHTTPGLKSTFLPFEVFW